MHDQMKLQMFTYNKHFQQYQKDDFVMVSAIAWKYSNPRINNIHREREPKNTQYTIHVLQVCFKFFTH